MKQTTFASAAWAAKGKTTRRERFLAEMNAVMPWAKLVALIEPYYPKAGNGRQPMPLECMLRVYFMQQWFNLSDPQAEDSLYDIEPMRRFAGIELAEDVVPDETTILRFRHLLEEHQLTQAMFAEVRSLLEERGLLLKSGTIVDATIIAAPSSSKNAAEERDPEMHQTKKGKNWHFGMKLHIGADKRGLVHSVATGPANEADITRLDDLLHGEENELYGDQAYWSEDHRQQCKHAGIRYRVNRRAKPGKELTAHEKLINRSRSRRRAWRIPLRCRQAPVGLYQGALPRSLQEHGTRLRDVRALQPLSHATTIDASRGKLRSVRAKKQNRSTKNPKSGLAALDLHHLQLCNRA